MSVIISEVKTRKELKKFVQFGIDLYENCESFCPPLIFDELNTLDSKKNPAFDVCEAIYFLAYKDGKIAGRIAGIINKQANAHWNVQKVRFGWFDFIDDKEVSKALLDAVVAWGKSKGMNALNGPVGFTDLDHQGLLLEGYEYLSLMAALYNYPYYVEHFDAYGLTKEADWVEIRVQVPEVLPEKMSRVANLIADRYKVKATHVKNSKELIKRYGYSFFDLIDTAYKQLYNYSPLTEKQKKYYSDLYFPILNFDLVSLLVNEKDELVGVGVAMPNISKELRKTKGKLFPLGWYHLLKALNSKTYESSDLLLIAVRPDYQNKGINSLIFTDQLPFYQKHKVKYASVTAILETNMKSMSNFLLFDHEIYKRRRAYIKQI
jgi:GNAT superfamily N-acetyltransferase